jgi:hypothetical protein
MAEIRCTKKLLSRISRESRSVGTGAGSDVLGDWVANVVPIMGGELILVLNEKSLLTLVLPASELEGLPAAIALEASRLLGVVGAPQAFVESALAEISEARPAPNQSRHFVGLLNQVTYAVQDAADFVPPARLRNQLALEQDLLDWLYGPHPNYLSPRDELARVIGAFGT